MCGLKVFAIALTAGCAACAAAKAAHDPASSVKRDSGPARAATARESGSASRPAGQTDGFEQEILASHNRYRAAAGVPPLRWDPELAASARAFAPSLVAAGDIIHSARATRPGQGENLWMGSAGGESARRATENWVAERRNFRPGTFPNVSKTRDWNDVSHYSQMIWPATTRLGCARSHGGAYDFVVCRYSPSGNRDGQRVP
jgi:hypothetical protein